MKKISQIFFLFALAILYGQQISNYKHINIQESKDFKNNKYGVLNFLTAKLKQKNYNILAVENSIFSNIPKCDILSAEVLDSSSLFKNRITLNFNDCEHKTIMSIKGASLIKEYEEGFQDAIMQAVKIIPVSKPIDRAVEVDVENSAPVTMQEATQKGNAVINTETKLETETAATQSSSSQTYSNGKITMNRIFLSNSQFILVNPNNSVPYATFKPSTKANVYHVTLADGLHTIGYTENNEIVVELATSNGSYRKETFTSK